MFQRTRQRTRRLGERASSSCPLTDPLALVHQARVLAWVARDSAGFFEWLARLPWYRQILADWGERVPVTSDTRVLEVGCGPGVFTAHLSRLGAHVTAVDRSAAMVETARRNAPAARVLEGDALDLPLPGDVVDTALAASVINLVDEPARLLQEMSRVTRSGGAVSVLFPTPRLRLQSAEIGRGLGLRGLSRASLTQWGAKAPARTTAEIVRHFAGVDLIEPRVDLLLHGTVACVTGRVP